MHLTLPSACLIHARFSRCSHVQYHRVWCVSKQWCRAVTVMLSLVAWVYYYIRSFSLLPAPGLSGASRSSSLSSSSELSEISGYSPFWYILLLPYVYDTTRSSPIPVYTHRSLAFLPISYNIILALQHPSNGASVHPFSSSCRVVSARVCFRTSVPQLHAIKSSLSCQRIT